MSDSKLIRREQNTKVEYHICNHLNSMFAMKAINAIVGHRFNYVVFVAINPFNSNIIYWNNLNGNQMIFVTNNGFYVRKFIEPNIKIKGKK